VFGSSGAGYLVGDKLYNSITTSHIMNVSSCFRLLQCDFHSRDIEWKEAVAELTAI
jgi:hypothetical protein